MVRRPRTAVNRYTALPFGLPLWSAGRLDAGAVDTMLACLVSVAIFPLMIRVVRVSAGR